MRRNYCRSVISLQEPLPVDLFGPPWHPTHRQDSRILCGFYLCVLATYAPCLQHHVIVSTAQKVSPTSLLPAQSVAVSASADRQPSVHIVKGISQHIHNNVVYITLITAPRYYQAPSPYCVLPGTSYDILDNIPGAGKYSC